MDKDYSFAGIDVTVSIPDERMYTDERHLEPFRVENVSNPHHYRFSVVDSLEPPCGACTAAAGGFRVYQEGGCTVRYIGSVNDSWKPAYARAVHNGRNHEIQLLASQYPDRVGVKTVLNCMAVEHLVMETGGVVFHSSYICYNDKAILFTAPSQTGKSTQAELWRSLRGAEILNGDRSVIRWADDKAYACGIPFAGSSVYCQNRTMPLVAVVYLGQAPVTSIRRLRGYEAFARLWEGCSVNTWDPDDMRMASETVTHIAGAVPVFHMPCTPDESAVIALENALKEAQLL